MKSANLLVSLSMYSLAQAENVIFKNQCEFSIDVYDNDRSCTLDAGSRWSPVHGCNSTFTRPTMYRHQQNPEATLAEFSVDETKAWYDISIIPPGSPDDCMSLEECKERTHTTGYNVPVMILPTRHLNAYGYRCHRVMCERDGCEDAYHYPKDNSKVHDCPNDEVFEVIYCP
ncbi:hypothetical protein Poli38472_011276 [Pythium oligandrum]|uniref:Secreted protein n=1 Tax=Pythium oligandrum TaxID=41045 RepID=A0A8K1CPY2_PYTOL|nr:hypothetical protein Poli38472_011276 [Pythium oligandrum]|eukprot:TMW67656.1 hypothetical protein Poli38472_011276 [Pythium oligandrum]